jgi:hypothetical protein
MHDMRGMRVPLITSWCCYCCYLLLLLLPSDARRGEREVQQVRTAVVTTEAEDDKKLSHNVFNCKEGGIRVKVAEKSSRFT